MPFNSVRLKSVYCCLYFKYINYIKLRKSFKLSFKVWMSEWNISSFLGIQINWWQSRILESCACMSASRRVWGLGLGSGIHVHTGTNTHAHGAYVGMWAYAWIEKKAHKQIWNKHMFRHQQTHMFTLKMTRCTRLFTLPHNRIIDSTKVLLI